MAHRTRDAGILSKLPLFLMIWGIASLAMWVPAALALVQDDHHTSRSFFYSGILGLFVVSLIALSLGNRNLRHRLLGQLLSLLGVLAILPLFLALPLFEALGTTTYLNAYFDMVSAVTTTGADLFADPGRLSDPLHLWRAMVAWLGGFLMWVAASAILAPMSLGGFEITARGEPGRTALTAAQMQRADPRKRLIRITWTLAPVYAGLTGALWILLMILGEPSLVGLCHAMSVLATSGLSPVGGLENAQSGMAGEAVLFLFMFFALSRLTFSSDTAASGMSRLDKDPEFRIGLLLVVAIPVVLFLRHWIGSLEVNAGENSAQALRAFWGSMFTVMSFLTTTGFESSDWGQAQQWSGLNTPGIILLGLSVIGGGVATTAGGVKLLRVYALYLNGLRDMERLVHPSSVSGQRSGDKRIQKNGAFVAWIFFMLFALTLAFFSVTLAALGADFEEAMVLSISALSTTGPLVHVAVETPIQLAALPDVSKIVLCFAMMMGRLETLALIALFTPDLWRG
jgi:trk system potassium uptake protein TrkH